MKYRIITIALSKKYKCFATCNVLSNIKDYNWILRMNTSIKWYSNEWIYYVLLRFVIKWKVARKFSRKLLISLNLLPRNIRRYEWRKTKNYTKLKVLRAFYNLIENFIKCKFSAASKTKSGKFKFSRGSKLDYENEIFFIRTRITDKSKRDKVFRYYFYGWWDKYADS